MNNLSFLVRPQRGRWAAATLCLVAVLAMFTLLLCCGPAEAKRARHLFKIGSLAPEGSVWAKRFHAFADEVRSQSNGDIDFKIYPGGVMGDDRTMFRKMRVGQLHGGGFTMTGISELVPDFRVMGIPLLFHSYEEVDWVNDNLYQRLDQEFAEKNLVLLAVSEVGFLYPMSTSPIATLSDLRQTKCWAPEGDPVSNKFLKILGVAPIQLSIPDVLTSLQTGLIDTTFNSFYGSIVLQWFTRTRYITDIPFAYAYGALVLDRRAFAKLSDAQAGLMLDAAKRHFADLNQDTRKSNADALTVLKQNGISLVQASPDTKATLEQTREQTVAALVGTAFSREIYQETMTLLERFRKNREPPASEPGSAAAH